MVVERQERQGERAVEAIEAAASERGVAVEKVFRRGVPHEEIVRYVERGGMDLIAMGTHGRTGLDRVAHTGSTTERVVRTSAVPVLTARLKRR